MIGSRCRPEGEDPHPVTVRPPQPERIPIGRQLASTRVVAILRAEHAGRAEAVADVLVANGIRCLELTLTTEGALDVVERLAAKLPQDVEVGVGTVLSAGDVDRAVDAGARFVVSPTVEPEVVAAALRRGVASYPGAMTPTEIQAAWTLGASAVKLFPAGTLGTGHLKVRPRPAPARPARADRRGGGARGRCLAGRGCVRRRHGQPPDRRRAVRRR